MVGFEISGVLPVGFQLAERYRIIKHLAAGGFGITYLAEHEALKKQYAIKEHFPREFASREGTSVRPNMADRQIFDWAKARFIEEAQKLAKFKHPAIVDVTDVFEANGTAYMVMAFVPGQTMARWLDDLGRPPRQAELDRLAAPLLDALDMLHANTFIHRDIAPDNIIVQPDGSPCLIDFGAARQAMGQQTKTLTAIVKPGFSPVEQYDSDGSIGQGASADIYALAATFYRAVTGSKPPEAPGRTLKDSYVPAKAAAMTTYRPDFLEAIDLALKVYPAERPPTIAAFRKLLEPIPARDGPLRTDDVGTREPPPTRRTDADEAASWERVKRLRREGEARWHLQRVRFRPALWVGALTAGLVVAGLATWKVLEDAHRPSPNTGVRQPATTVTTPPEVPLPNIDDVARLTRERVGEGGAYWKNEIQAVQTFFDEPGIVLFRGVTFSPCHSMGVSGNFYCWRDKKLYFDLEFFESLPDIHRGTMVTLVAAQLLGQHVQYQTGLRALVEGLAANPRGEKEARRDELLELHAYCLAGVWLGQRNFRWLDAGDAVAAAHKAIAKLEEFRKNVVNPFQSETQQKERVEWLGRGWATSRRKACQRLADDASK